MNQRPLVSVVVPTYDRPEYLVGAVESVCAQSYHPVELLVVDDCSPRPAEPVVDDVDTGALDRVRVIRHETNLGGNAARNTGIEAARGDIIAFLDDDDRWEPTVVETYVRAFRDAGDDVGLVGVGSKTLDADGDRVGALLPDFGDDPVETLLSGMLVGSFSRFAVRRWAVDAAGLPDERFPAWQDWEWQFRLAQHCRFASVPEPLVVRREAGHGQITDNFERRATEAYPLLLDAYLPAMAERSERDARRFRALLTRTLGHHGLYTGHYREGVRYLLRSLRFDPTNPQTYLYLLLGLGGPLTYEPAVRAKRLFSALSTRLPSKRGTQSSAAAGQTGRE